jgi:hypothetical protein
MVNPTQRTESRRAHHHKRAGIKRKRTTRAHGTPAFPVQPEGYDPNAPDAKGQKPARG